jgi:hypothetical protein
MVRRGSTVRVRQRASFNRAIFDVDPTLGYSIGELIGEYRRTTAAFGHPPASRSQERDLSRGSASRRFMMPCLSAITT